MPNADIDEGRIWQEFDVAFSTGTVISSNGVRRLLPGERRA
jgi:hypothetical protein